MNQLQIIVNTHNGINLSNIHNLVLGPNCQGFNYCKLVVQVDGTFLISRYQRTLLTTLAQNGSRNIFPLAFAIVEGETKEALIWFFQLLREHVTPQSNLCLITDKGKDILAALQSEEVEWEENGLQSVYCIRHIASNFNKKFKNHALKSRLKNMGNILFFHSPYYLFIENGIHKLN